MGQQSDGNFIRDGLLFSKPPPHAHKHTNNNYEGREGNENEKKNNERTLGNWKRGQSWT